MLTISEGDPRWRKPVRVSMGPHLVGAAMPHPDIWDTQTAQAGVLKRLAVQPPAINRALLRRFRTYVRREIRRRYLPIPAEADTSVEKWLEGTNYPDWRKKDLLEKWASVEGISLLQKRHYAVKSFMKDEEYPEFKHGRGINSRTDQFKCAVGPIFKLIEQATFKHHHFIKYVPVADRPAYIKNKISKLGGKYVATDYTSFESCFVRELLEACEFELYDYMTRNLPEHRIFMNLMHGVLGGVNECHWRRFIAWVIATRMSGEMCTSLGNGFTNDMLMCFLCEEVNHTDVDGVVEGDDGLFSVAGDPPTAEQFAELGMIIKLEVHESLNTASFCGIVFDEEDLKNLTDPLEVVTKFGYANHRYVTTKTKKIRMLLRCKALSLAHQYPGCPVIQSLAWYGLRVTHGVRNYLEGWVRRSGPAGMSMWERDQLLEAIARQDSLAREPIGHGSRLLVEKLWRISLPEQMGIEAYLDAKDDLSPLHLPSLVARVPPAWLEYWARYAVEDANVLDDQLCEPRLPLGPLSGLVQEWAAG